MAEGEGGDEEIQFLRTVSVARPAFDSIMMLFAKDSKLNLNEN